MKTELIPPDLNQCQCEKSNGVNAFTLGGRHEMVRCKNEPVFIATETTPDSDGVVGSMSLCQFCAERMLKQLGPHYASLEAIKKVP